VTPQTEQRRLQALIEHGSEMIGLHDREGTITYVSPSTTRWLGYQPSDLVGRPTFDVVHPDDRERIAEIFADLVSRPGHSVTTEYRLLLADGTWRWVEGTGTNSLDEPDLNAIVLNYHDITDRKRAEDALREKESQYRSIFEASTDGMTVTDLDTGIVVEVNPAFCQMHGFTREELVGMHSPTFIHPDDHALFGAYLASIRSGREFRARARNVRKDGSAFPVDVVGKSFVYQGRLHVLGVIRDITEQLEAERVLEDRVEARTRELRALYRADETLYRSLRLGDILQALVDEATDLLAADKTTVLVWDASHERLVPGASRGFSPESLAQMRHAPGEGITGAVAQTGKPIAVENVELDSRVARHITDREQIRSLLHVPITVGDEVFGVFGINYCQPRRFNGDELRLLTALAQRAALAISNARLYEQTERHSREIEALYRADEALHASLKVDDVLQSLVDVVTDLLRVDKTAVMVWDDAHERLVARAGRGFSQDTLRRMVHGPGDGVTWLVAQSGAPIVVNDVRNDPRVARHLSDPEGIRSLLQVPISVAGEVFGVFGVNHCQLHVFSADEERVLIALAQRAALAIENARLYEQAQGKAALEERQKLARELHDSVSQALYGIALGARTARTLLDRDPSKVAEPLDYVLGLAEAGLVEMRSLIFELRPESLEQEGLVAALEKLAASLRARYDLRVEITAAEEPGLRLRDKEALFRVAQEALHNIAKHAHATRVDVRLTCGAENVELQIADDGVGFDPQHSYPGHLGLKSMPERIARAGGTFMLESAPGHGTRVMARVAILARQGPDG
jgi:PAS domain S-box-containing protein